jgi:hypothetical protein
VTKIGYWLLVAMVVYVLCRFFLPYLFYSEERREAEL